MTGAGTHTRKMLGAGALAGAVLLAACSSGSSPDAGHSRSPAVAPLRESASRRGLRFGAAVTSDLLAKDSQYRHTLATEYNAVTPENAMKWDAIHPARDRYDFGPADAIVNFARAHHMAVRGHNLVWYREVPSWVTDHHWTRRELEQILHDHIRTVVRHYRGKVAQWDVVNEAVDKDGKLRDSIWSKVIGPTYIELAFRWAHEEDPSAKLYYNDYDIESPGPKASAVTKLVRGLRARGVPIDGVGIQGHEVASHPPSPHQFESALRTYAAMGLDVAVTEADVALSLPANEHERQVQAAIYDHMLRACLAVSRCRTFVTWGLTDRSSWVPAANPGTGDALPFDRDYHPKPALGALRTVLARARH